MADNGKNGKAGGYLEAADEAADKLIALSKFKYSNEDGKLKPMCRPSEKLSEDELETAVALYQNFEMAAQHLPSGLIATFDAERKKKYSAARSVGKKYSTFWSEIERIEEPELIEEDAPEEEVKAPDYEDTEAAQNEIFYVASKEPNELSNKNDEKEMNGIVSGMKQPVQPASEPMPAEAAERELTIMEYVAEARAYLKDVEASTNESLKNCVEHVKAMRDSLAEIKDEMYINYYEIQELQGRKNEDEVAADKREIESTNRMLDGTNERCDILLKYAKEQTQ